MKPKMDHKIIRPGGRKYDILAKTDLASKFAAIRREQAAAAKRATEAEAEAIVKVKQIRRKA